MLTDIILSITEIFIVFAVGAFACKLGYIRQNDIAPWSAIIIDFLFPVLVFSSIIKNFNPERLSELWLLPLIGFGLMLFGAILGFFLKHGLKNKGAGRLSTFHHFCAVNNYGFLPIIIISNLWGEKYLPLLFFLNIGSNAAYWTIGVALLGTGDIRKTLRNLLSPTLIALVTAVVISVSGFKSCIPELAVKICSNLGAAAIPFMLLLIGASLYDSKKVFENKRDIIYLSFIRLILIPLLSILLLWLLPLPDDAYRVAFVVAIMPVSVSTVVLTRKYGGSPDLAGQAALITTIASIISIPLLMMLIN